MSHNNSYGKDRAWPFAEGGGGTILMAAGALIVAYGLRVAWRHPLTLVLLVVAALFGAAVLWFFRDPNRKCSAETTTFYAPGDGKIVHIAPEHETRYLNTEMTRITIFMDVYNVHVQRFPLAGTIRQIDPRPGQFLKAFKAEASEVNEQIGMVVESDKHGSYIVKQIAGILARRCINKMTVGDKLSAGQRYGLIRFGSRLDIFLPLTATITVKKGDTVKGGLTPLAQFES